jgi:hypothetical protein
VWAAKFRTHTKQLAKIVVLYIWIFIFFDSKLEDKTFCTEWQQAFPDFNLLLISSWMEFWFVRVVPKYLNCSTVSNDSLPICMLIFFSAFWSQDLVTHLVFTVLTL